jgi:antitoxin (DNA-binding transcriptional repressor) of toxin-antitoxin stability system
VKAGETVLIVDRGRPVARLESALSATEADQGRIAPLERAGIARRGKNRLVLEIVNEEPLQAGDSSVLQALLDERHGGQ